MSIHDTFDEASAVNLSAHAPNTGGAWTNRTFGGNNNPWNVGAGTGLVTATSGDALYTNADDLGSANHYAEIVLTRSGFGGVLPHVVIHWVDNNNYYALGVSEYGTSRLRLARVVAGVETEPATWNWSPSDGDHTIRIQYLNGTIKGFTVSAGTPTERLSYADPSPITSQGLAGLLGQGTVKTFDAVALAPPVITDQPDDITEPEGDTATFSVTATGATSYQWQIQQSGAGAWSNVSGATSASYTTGTLVAADDNTDKYRCVCTNAYGDTTSSSATLTVVVPDTTPPTLTGSITVTSLTTTSYTITCPVATDNVAVTGYEYRIEAGSWTTIAAGGRSASITGRTPGNVDTVDMRAFDAANNKSTPALTVDVTLPTDTTAPTHAGTVTISLLTPTSYTATWPAATDNIAVGGYEYSLDGGSNWETPVGSGTLSANISGRTPSTTDQFRVRAFDAASNVSDPPLAATVNLPAPATITTEAFKSWADDNTPLTSLTVDRVSILRMDGTLAVTLANQLTHASTGVLAIQNAALAAGTAYMVATWDTAGLVRGLKKYTAA
jgi:hypothetical protein